MIRSVSTLLCLILMYPVFAQLKQPVRIELNVPPFSAIQYNVIPAGEDGVFVWSILPSDDLKNVLLDLKKFTSDLSIASEKQYVIQKNHTYIDHYQESGYVYFLFGNFSNKVRELSLMRIDSETGERREWTMYNSIPLLEIDLMINSDQLILSGIFNYRPIVILYDLNTLIPRVLPGLFDDKALIIEIYVDSFDFLNVVLSGRNDDNRGTIFIKTYSQEGNLIKVVELESYKRKAPLFGRTLRLEDGSELVAGVYGRNRSDYSRGVFVANINIYGEQKLMYYNYADFENFFNYMREGRERRVRNRIARRRIKGKKIKFNYRLIVHEVIEDGEQVIMLGEAFYPKYRYINNNFSRYSIYARARDYNRVFLGYQYTHSIVLGFDKQGNLLWDNSFEIQDELTKTLKQYVYVMPGKDDDIRLLSVFDQEIKTKQIRGNDVKFESSVPIEIGQGDEVVSNSTQINGMEPWTEGSFLVYGTQTLRNNQQYPRNRTVFFINKITNE